MSELKTTIEDCDQASVARRMKKPCWPSSRRAFDFLALWFTIARCHRKSHDSVIIAGFKPTENLWSLRGRRKKYAYARRNADGRCPKSEGDRSDRLSTRAIISSVINTSHAPRSFFFSLGARSILGGSFYHPSSRNGHFATWYSSALRYSSPSAFVDRSTLPIDVLTESIAESCG